jgi:nucleoside-diphosphate-sugar epimerase
MRKNKKIFITGGTGFIGKNLLNFLDGSRYQITVLARELPAENYKNIKFVRGDLIKNARWPSAIRNADAIFHLAAEIKINESFETPRAIIETNIAMTLSLLEAVRKSGKKPLIVFASTDRLYGKTKNKVVTEDEPAVPIEPYSASKLISEKIIESYHLLFDIPYIILRSDSVFGPHQSKAMFISDVIQKMVGNDTIKTGNLSVEKNFIFVDDFVEALLKAAEAPPPSQNTIYNIGGAHTSLQKVLTLVKQIIEKKTGKKIKVIVRPKLSRPAKIEVNPFRLSTKKARDMLKWEPKVSLKNGLVKTVDYFLSSAPFKTP